MSLELSAIVSYRVASKKAVGTVTDVRIRVDNLEIATATLGGKYSQNAAVREFKRHPARFNVNAENYLLAFLGGVS